MSASITMLFFTAFLETLCMVLGSALLAVLVGLPLGIFLASVKQGERISYSVRILGAVVNIVRSIPFIILMVMLSPVTEWVFGTSIGTGAAIFPLAVGAIAFFARLVEAAMKSMPVGLIELAASVGATRGQMLRYILLPEAMPALVRAITLTIIALVGYSAMAGAIGGGGLGDLAIQYGYQRFNLPIMISTVIMLILCVQFVQFIGNRWAKFCSRQVVKAKN